MKHIIQAIVATSFIVAPVLIGCSKGPGTEAHRTESKKESSSGEHGDREGRRSQVPQDATKADITQSTTGAISKASDIVGTWSMSRMNKEIKSMQYTFRDDGTLTAFVTFHDEGEPMKTTGKYEVKESTLRLLYAGKSRWREVQIQLVGEELVFYGNNQSKDYFRRK